MAKAITKKRRPATRSRELGDCPGGDCCLFRLGLVQNNRSNINYTLGPPHDCGPAGETASGNGSLVIKLKSTGLPCDEPHVPIPLDSELSAKIHAIHRKDDLAFMCGTFTLSDPNTAQPKAC